MSVTEPAAPRRRQRRQVVLLRPVPGSSPVHALWAGTKLVAVFAFSVLLTFYPGWVPIGLVALVVAIGVALARIPRGALPSVPVWLWALLALGGVTAALGGGEPYVVLGGVQLGLGGLLSFTRVTLIALVLLGLCMLVSWTTDVADLAPAIAKLFGPLKVLRVPVDDLAVATALALRSFPMLIDEFRVLYAARKLRPEPAFAAPRRRRWVLEFVDLLAAAITAALRRGDEMGDAITARGGTGQIAASPKGPTWRDWLVFVVITVVCVGSVVFELLVLKTSP